MEQSASWPGDGAMAYSISEPTPATARTRTIQHQVTSESSEDERMQQILDEDDHMRKYGDVLPSSSHSSFSRIGLRSGNRSVGLHDGGAAASSAPSSLLVDFDDYEIGYEDDDDQYGIFPFISSNCILPQFLQRPHAAQAKSRQRKRGMTWLPFILLSLILYGFISMVMDVANSIRTYRDGRVGSDGRIVMNSKRVSNFNSAQFRTGARSMDLADGGSPRGGSTSSQVGGGSGLKSLQFEPPDEFNNFPGNIDKNYPRPEDVAAITEHILSTIFGNALELKSETQPNEIQFFWTIGGTPGRGPAGRFPAKIGKCFPNVVQAGGGGGDEEGVAEEELRSFANELRVIQRRVPQNVIGREVEGMSYVNVDLFTSDGVRRAADLELLFPTRPFLVVHEHDHNGAAISPNEGAVTTTEMEVPTTDEDRIVTASSQIHLMESGFLPEIMGLFAPPSTWKGRDDSLPKARIHAIFPPTSVRISLYYRYHKNDILAGISYLQFLTSPSIVVNNYVTRTLSGQWEEGSPLNEAHLEIAKNVLSRKIHLWPNQGMKDMVLHWVENCGWQEGAIQFRQKLVSKYGQDLKDLVLGLDCMFPPKDGSDAAADNAPVAAEKPQPSELDVEINNIIKQRNRLDENLFHYVMKVYRSWVSTAASN